jgi:hypothetical protein
MSTMEWAFTIAVGAVVALLLEGTIVPRARGDRGSAWGGGADFGGADGDGDGGDGGADGGGDGGGD